MTSIEPRRKRAYRVHKIDQPKAILPSNFDEGKFYYDILRVASAIANDSSIRTSLNAVRTVLLDCGLTEQWNSMRNALRMDLREFKSKLPFIKRMNNRTSMQATSEESSEVRAIIESHGIKLTLEWNYQLALWSEPSNGLIKSAYPKTAIGYWNMRVQPAWKVLSRTTNRIWTVRELTGTLMCDCPSYQKSQRLCFHTQAVKFYQIKLREVKRTTEPEYIKVEGIGLLPAKAVEKTNGILYEEEQ